jgi:hypothetical protein
MGNAGIDTDYQIHQVVVGRCVSEILQLVSECGFRRLRPGIPIERGHAFRSKATTCSDEGAQVSLPA